MWVSSRGMEGMCPPQRSSNEICALVCTFFISKFSFHFTSWGPVNETIKTFAVLPFWSRWEISGDVELLDVLWVTACGVRQSGQLEKGKGGCLCRRGLCDALLTASALNCKVWGDALVTGVKLTLTTALGWFEVVSRTAQKILPKILEQMPCEAHIDPGVTAAVEAGQQHGDDKGHGCRDEKARREVTVLRQHERTTACFLCEGKGFNGWQKVYLLSM